MAAAVKAQYGDSIEIRVQSALPRVLQDYPLAKGT